jgi:hypothetical protein
MIIDDEWERFPGGPSESRGSRHHVTISPDKKFQMNANVWRRLGKPETVYLYITRRRDVISIHPTSPEMPDAFPVRSRGNTYVIYAAPFFNHYGIKVATTHKFINPTIDPNGRLILNLSETIKATRLPRRRQPRRKA